MKFVFDPNQAYQKEAIDAVVDIFEGQPLNQGDFEVRFQHWTTFMGQSLEQNELGFGNNLILDDETLLANLHKVQDLNSIKRSPALLGHEIDRTPKWGKAKWGESVWAAEDSVKSLIPHFSIEMETGTGKTYVYLRSILELNKKYGFKKFI